jgi:hypothetical protein
MESLVIVSRDLFGGWIHFGFWSCGDSSWFRDFVDPLVGGKK